MNRRRVARIGVLALVLLALLAVVAWARPGGGESFSGGGGGGGDDDGGWIAVIELIVELIYYCIVFPEIALPLLGIIAVIIVIAVIRSRRDRNWDSGHARAATATVDAAPEPRGRRDLRDVDPDFSWVLFEDFAFRLFATAHGARGDARKMDALAPYLSEGVRASLQRRSPPGAAVSRVIVGAMRTVTADVPSSTAPDAKVEIVLELESNYTTAATAAADAAAPVGSVPRGAGETARTWYAIERWSFTRGRGVHTKPPRTTRDFPCPNCGAPWEAKETAGGQTCTYCGQVVDNGRFDWLVTAVSLVGAEPRPPTLTTEVPERGTDLPTVRDHGVSGAWQKLLAGDPALTRESFDARVDLAYRTLNDAWARNALEPARGFVSDGLYDYLSYWVDAYASQGLRNQLDDMRITKRTLAKVVRDRWYDAVTVRLWATGKDYVVDGAGKIVRGSKTSERPYSEYWTFVRSAARKGAVVAAKTCPKCGAPLSISMAGNCESCGVHVTAGEFDWVLSKIEQDDTYRG